jgi:hypothetical protein
MQRASNGVVLAGPELSDMPWLVVGLCHGTAAYHINLAGTEKTIY